MAAALRFIDIPIKNLLRRRGRTELTILGIAVAVAAFVSLVGLSGGLEHSWRNSLDERGTHLLVTERGLVEILASSLPQTLVEKIRRVEGVANAAGELVKFAPVDGRLNVLTSGWPADSYLWRNLKLAAGRLPQHGERHAAVLGEDVAKTLGKRPGDKLDLLNTEFTIVGIARFTGSMNNGMAYVPLATLQELMFRGDSVTLINIELRNPGSPAAVASAKARLAAAVPGLTVSETAEAAAQNKVIAIFRSISWATSAIALVMGVLSVLNTLLMAVTERTYELGILSALGWSRRRILAMIQIEGLILAVFGGAIGLVLGVFAARGIAALPFLNGLLEPTVTWRTLLEAAGAVAVIGVLGSAYPAWRATRLDISTALRRK
ncbi:MAG: ABC transporter permease [Rhodospirillaceae bacterium]|nr:ABC transporter permease [Rhodospirillaceae bacterium]